MEEGLKFQFGVRTFIIYLAYQQATSTLVIPSRVWCFCTLLRWRLPERWWQSRLRRHRPSAKRCCGAVPLRWSMRAFCPSLLHSTLEKTLVFSSPSVIVCHSLFLRFVCVSKPDFRSLRERNKPNTDQWLILYLLCSLWIAELQRKNHKEEQREEQQEDK